MACLLYRRVALFPHFHYPQLKVARKLPGGGKLWATVMAGEPPGSIRFTLPARPGQAAREVRQSVYARRVTLAGGVTATCVVARERQAPAGEKAAGVALAEPS
jgi:hypothetical protein